MGKFNSIQQMILNIHPEKNVNLDPYLIPYTKSKLRGIIGLSITIKNIKLLEENLINYYYDLDPRN